MSAAQPSFHKEATTRKSLSDVGTVNRNNIVISHTVFGEIARIISREQRNPKKAPLQATITPLKQ